MGDFSVQAKEGMVLQRHAGVRTEESLHWEWVEVASEAWSREAIGKEHTAEHCAVPAVAVRQQTAVEE